MSHTARPDLDERRVESLRLYAGLVGQYLGGRHRGFEALSRFPPPDRNPLRWLGDA